MCAHSSSPLVPHLLQMGQPCECTSQHSVPHFSRGRANLCAYTAVSPYLCTFSGREALLQVLQCFASSPLPGQGSPSCTHCQWVHTAVPCQTRGSISRWRGPVHALWHPICPVGPSSRRGGWGCIIEVLQVSQSTCIGLPPTI